MDTKKMKKEQGAERRNSDEYVVRHSFLANVIALVLCVAIALVLWVVVMNTADSDQICTEVLNPNDTYEYVLSLDHLEVEGTVAALRLVRTIGVKVPQGAVPGVYALTEEDLVIPAGVQLTKPLSMTLTVKAK